jgi:hypothetical protein
MGIEHSDGGGEITLPDGTTVAFTGETFVSAEPAEPAHPLGASSIKIEGTAAAAIVAPPPPRRPPPTSPN